MTQMTPSVRARLRRRDDLDNLGRLTRALAYVAAALTLGMFAAAMSGCATDAAVKRQVATEAASAVADVREWPTLSDVERFELFWRYARFALDLDLALNGRTLPDLAEVVALARRAVKAPGPVDPDTPK